MSKWVNLGKGWRPRLFVLKGGVLRYYRVPLLPPPPPPLHFRAPSPPLPRHNAHTFAPPWTASSAAFHSSIVCSATHLLLVELHNLLVTDKTTQSLPSEVHGVRVC